MMIGEILADLQPAPAPAVVVALAVKTNQDPISPERDLFPSRRPPGSRPGRAVCVPITRRGRASLWP